MDVVDRKTRSRMMREIGSKNTKPELLFRKHLFSMGFRYRINDRMIAGSPDIVFPKYHALLFMDVSGTVMIAGFSGFPGRIRNSGEKKLT
jgi:DNA mismatch endonuclease Vsr